MKREIMTLLVMSVVAMACTYTDLATVVPDSQMSIAVANGTSIEVGLVVNGLHIRTIPPLTNLEVQAAQLPALPWHVDLTTASGRSLVALDVRSGDVQRFANGSGGVGRRVDLSCGRLDVYSGPPMLGPMPGPGVPGDCD
jgi:hypothetical protein